MATMGVIAGGGTLVSCNRVEFSIKLLALVKSWTEEGILQNLYPASNAPVKYKSSDDNPH